MKYRSQPVEIDAMQWTGWTERFASYERADEIVAWVNANGGEARLVPRWHDGSAGNATEPHIMVRTNSGWAPVAPGSWVIKGSETFTADTHLAEWGGVEFKTLLNHYPVSDLSKVRVPLTWESALWEFRTETEVTDEHAHDGADQCMAYRSQVKRETFAQRWGAGRPSDREKYAQAVAEAIALCGDAIRKRKSSG